MGVVSNGMLCSGDELGLTTDADGILILAPETPLGAKLADLYGDVVLDVDVKPNRGDALSIVGIAREVAAVTGGQVARPARPRSRNAARTSTSASRWRSRTSACARASSGAGSRASTSGPSPDWVQMRLLAAGIRPISQRRRRLELRDGRAGQADPHVRCRRGGARRAGPGEPAGAARRGRGAGRDARPRRSGARSGDAAHRRRERPARRSPA